MILAGDVGGTKVDLVLCKFDNGQLLTVHDHKYHARDFPGLVQVVEAFLVECKQTLGQPAFFFAAKTDGQLEPLTAESRQADSGNPDAAPTGSLASKSSVFPICSYGLASSGPFPSRIKSIGPV